MYGTENIVIYDWLSFTSKQHTPEELVMALGLTHCPWQEIKGAHGYRSRKYFSCISIHYDGRDDMGVWVEMSGQGCRAFETLSDVGWDNLFQFINSNHLNITRLDVAFDDHTGILDIGRIVDDTRDGNYVSRSDYWETLLSSKGTSVQIGSPQSKVLIRIYDKARERNCELGTHWIRVELQLRGDRAIQFMQLPMTLGDAFSGVILNYLRYVIPNDEDSNKWRWEMQPYWMDLLTCLSPISIYSTPGMEYNEERCKKYVVNQAGNAIAAMIEIHGLLEFKHMIDNRETAHNPKYDHIVAQSRFEKLARKCAQFFTIK